MRLIGHETGAVGRRNAIVSEADLTDGVVGLPARQAAGEANAGARTVIPLREAAGARTRTRTEGGRSAVSSERTEAADAR